MKNKYDELRFRLFNWKAYAKIPILLVTVAISLFLAINSHSFMMSLGNFSTNDPLQVYYFDVGQASSTLVIMPSDEAILIDTGWADTSSELVASVEYVLSQNGIADLSILILSHSDADHVGGASAILARFNPETIYRPLIASSDEANLASETGCLKCTTSTYKYAIEAVYDEDCEVLFHSNTTLMFDEATFTMYAPEKAYYSETNSYSPYITIKYQGVTFLFTGDATSTREAEFLSMLETSGKSLHVDVLEVPHHGSKYSSTEEFLSAISPTYAVVSAGDSTHPSDEVLERLEQVGVSEVFVTKEVGTVCVGVTKSGEIVFKSSSVYIDFPLIIVLLFCLMFVIFKMIDDKNAINQSQFFVFWTKFLTF